MSTGHSLALSVMLSGASPDPAIKGFGIIDAAVRSPVGAPDIPLILGVGRVVSVSDFCPGREGPGGRLSSSEGRCIVFFYERGGTMDLLMAGSAYLKAPPPFVTGYRG